LYPPRVLIVEDETLVSLMIEDVVTRAGWQVVGPAARLPEALRLARRESLDGAILDVNLHGAVVYPAAEILAERGIPFLFVTGYATGELDERFEDRPVLRKPFVGPELLRALKRLVDRPVAPA
jgi:two-component system, chemotaxis family, sensor kinase Cph1